MRPQCRAARDRRHRRQSQHREPAAHFFYDASRAQKLLPKGTDHSTCRSCAIHPGRQQLAPVRQRHQSNAPGGLARNSTPLELLPGPSLGRKRRSNQCRNRSCARFRRIESKLFTLEGFRLPRPRVARQTASDATRRWRLTTRRSIAMQDFLSTPPAPPTGRETGTRIW